MNCRPFWLALAVTAVTAAPDSAAAQLETQLDETMAEALVPLLVTWIEAARDGAKAAGVEPIPQPIRAALAGYVPDEVLARVRWRVGDADFALPPGAIRLADVFAVTLDDVVIFKERSAALGDPKLWAHELKHVMQYAEWGIEEFARRVLLDYSAVEDEALEFRWQFMKQAGLTPPPAAPVE
jgi:hypothetical protein